MMVKAFLIALVCVLLLDALWLGLLAGNLYKKEVKGILRMSGDDFAPRWPAAAVVYVLLPLAFAFLVIPHSATVFEAAWRGALVGFIIYGVYDFTNLALLAKWTWTVTIIDVAWGAVLGGVTSAATKWALLRFWN